MTLAWEPDYLREECESDAEMNSRPELDLCFHGIPKDERCPDCLDESSLEGYEADHGDSVWPK